MNRTIYIRFNLRTKHFIWLYFRNPLSTSLFLHTVVYSFHFIPKYTNLPVRLFSLQRSAVRYLQGCSDRGRERCHTHPILFEQLEFSKFCITIRQYWENKNFIFRLRGKFFIFLSRLGRLQKTARAISCLAPLSQTDTGRLK